MSSLAVVALFINGIQAILPAPAFVEGTTSWVPARAVLERLGCEVLWDEPKAALMVHAPGGHLFVFTGEAQPRGRASLAMMSTFQYKKWQSIIYISMRDCATVVHGVATWSPELHRAYLTAPAFSANASPPETVNDIVAAGPDGFGKTYLVNGSYGGWPEPTPNSRAPRSQEVDAPQAWVLSDGRASVRCTNAQNPGQAVRFSPFGERGTPLQVLATAEPADDSPGLALRAYEVTKRQSEGGVTCRLEVARAKRGDAVLICAKVLGAPEESTDDITRGLKVTASADRKAIIPITTTIYTKKTSNNGTKSETTACFRWLIAEIPKGEYHITASLGDNVTSNEVTVTIGSR